MNGTYDTSATSASRRASMIVPAVLGVCALLVGLSATIAWGAGGGAGRGPVASEARELTVHESAHLHLTAHRHEVLVEEGYGSGTLSGKVILHVTLSYSNGSVTFTAYPPGGTISGRGEGSSYAKGNTAHFTGTASVTGGTGKYAHATARNVSVKGTLQRKTFAFFLELTGRLRY